MADSVDDHGLIIATEDIHVEDPWIVRPSSNHPGRFYFFNVDTSESKWSLPPETLGMLSRVGARHKRVHIASEPNTDSYDYDDRESTLPKPSGESDFHVVGGLGSGGFGVVVEVEHNISRRRYAMKVVNKNALLRRRDRQRLELEVKIMTKIKPSPFIQQCQGVFETIFSVCMVTDLQLGNDLFHHLMERLSRQGTGFSEKEARVLLAELTLALEHMHIEGFIHRDVKMENVMLDAAGHVKLIDFGLACELVDDVIPVSPTGTLAYMAPELVAEFTGGRHTDWWAVGVLAFEMLTGETPWSSSRNMMVMKRDITSSHDISPPSSISPEASHLISSLLKKDFRRRLGSVSDSEVKDATFFSAIDWRLMANQESPPAFAPVAAMCISTEDRSDAIAKYIDLHNEHSVLASELREPSSSHASMMGLRLVSELPPADGGGTQKEHPKAL